MDRPETLEQLAQWLDFRACDSGGATAEFCQMAAAAIRDLSIPRSGDDPKLPCDVRLPQALTLSAGVHMSTLWNALELRRKAGIVHFERGAKNG